MNKINKLKKAIEALKKIDDGKLLEREETKEGKELFDSIKEFNLKNDNQLNSVFEAICESDLLESTKRDVLDMLDIHLDMNFIESPVRDEINNYIIH
ncbi:TPA: hypothetical protein ACPOYJ_001857 [Haemophilus influenzae]